MATKQGNRDKPIHVGLVVFALILVYGIILAVVVWGTLATAPYLKYFSWNSAVP